MSDQFGTDPSLPEETDMLVLMGHPYTCNGGNRDWRTHHDHEVILVRNGNQLRCPECGRTQPLRRRPIEACAIGRGLKRSDKPHPVLDRLDLKTPCDHPVSKKILLTGTSEGPESADLLLLCECHYRLIYEVTLNK